MARGMMVLLGKRREFILEAKGHLAFAPTIAGMAKA